MTSTKTLPVFTTEEKEQAHLLLATQVALMMGRKLEEDDWASVYCETKKIPRKGWSNLNIDIMYKGLGVELKQLCTARDNIKSLCGTSLMHPSATRSIRLPNTENPIDAMVDILKQYGQLIEQRRKKVKEDAPGQEPDMRFGWLLWQRSLREFLYFEEEMTVPNPDKYTASWSEKRSSGARKESRNLWIFEKDTGKKRYSITTVAGAKIQPYFDVPSPQDANLYYFKVQGENYQEGLVRIWLTPTTAKALGQLITKLGVENLSNLIEKIKENPDFTFVSNPTTKELAVPVLLTTNSYQILTSSFDGISDEHLVQLLVDYVRKST